MDERYLKMALDGFPGIKQSQLRLRAPRRLPMENYGRFLTIVDFRRYSTYGLEKGSACNFMFFVKVKTHT
jgi:hypothetical protein